MTREHALTLSHLGFGHRELVARQCGYAVAKLRTRLPAALIDVLGMLDAERIVAMYYALPAGRREHLLRDHAWAHHVRRVDPEDVAEAVAYWDDMPDLHVSPDLPAEAQAQMHRFIREAARYREGLPNDLRCVVGRTHTHKSQED